MPCTVPVTLLTSVPVLWPLARLQCFHTCYQGSVANRPVQLFPGTTGLRTAARVAGSALTSAATFGRHSPHVLLPQLKQNMLLHLATLRSQRRARTATVFQSIRES
jgi:hypothetical protein